MSLYNTLDLVRPRCAEDVSRVADVHSRGELAAHHSKYMNERCGKATPLAGSSMGTRLTPLPTAPSGPVAGSSEALMPASSIKVSGKSASECGNVVVVPGAMRPRQRKIVGERKPPSHKVRL